mmetsp:Transcript_46561/g.39283  ORF Transcript_46561/g.39283 Transcript_46561/m.39283 type:complete len:191 (+) Transcript_46561:438-1010(+)
MSGRSSLNSSFREASFRSQISDKSDASRRMNTSHDSTHSTRTRSNKPRYEVPGPIEKTDSRGYSRSNSRVRLTSLGELEDAEESVENVPLPHEVKVVQLKQPKEVTRQPREYSVNEVKLPSEQPPRRHQASRPKLLKLLDNKESSRDKLRPSQPTRDRHTESPSMNITSFNTTPSNSSKKDGPHKNIYNT